MSVLDRRPTTFVAEGHTAAVVVLPLPTWLVESVHTWVGLLKLRVVLLLLLTSLVTAIATAEGAVPVVNLLFLALAGGLASGGAGALNHYFDRDIDALMPRTRTRPLPSGHIGNPRSVFVFGILLVAAAVLPAIALGFWATLFILAGAGWYVLVYTLGLKRRTPWNVVIGGLAGSFAVLAGGAAVGAPFSAVTLLLALLLFVWSPPHFWCLAMVYAGQYERAGVPMLPVTSSMRHSVSWIVIHALGLVLISLALGLAGGYGAAYYILAAVGTLLFGRMLWALYRNPLPARAWKAYKMSGMYLGMVLLGLLVSSLV